MILREYPKAIVHLRQQFQAGRLGLVFGAGISKSLGFPEWGDLVKGISSHKDTNGNGLFAESDNLGSVTSITQLLFQHFKEMRLEELKAEFPSFSYREKRVLSEWRGIIHDVLYATAGEDRKNKVASHPYLTKFISIINKTEFTVNYNFDDTLEFMLSQPEWNAISGIGKPYQVVWNPYMQFRDHTAVVYHPNGYLPADKNLHQSEHIVFSEESFSDQLIESMAGKLSSLMHLFTKKTCLLIGLSLDDNTLKHLLRQSASISPGNYHYFVRYTNGSSNLSYDEKRAIFNSNFEVYNLITLFLNDEGISELADFIVMEGRDFKTQADTVGVDIKYNYYLVGTVGAGKSFFLNYFGCLRQLEEWVDERPSELAKRFKDLSDEEKIKVDTWVGEQFKKKNITLKGLTEGINIIDRTPLDPITFINDDKDQQIRAKQIIESISPGQCNYSIELGHVIFLYSNSDEVKSRLLSKRKTDWDLDTIDILQDRALRIYDSFQYTNVENVGRTVDSVVKEIARIIFVDKYNPSNLHDKLVEISGYSL